MAEYPRREPFHAHKLTRLLFKSCAIQDIGNNAAMLIVYVAHTEDAARYQYPVRFWNGQLMHVMGWHSPKQLTEARRKAVEAGWLHYEREHDRSVGRYWTLIPRTVTAFNDEPIEPCFISENGKDIYSENGNENGKDSENGTHCGMGSGKQSGMGSGKPSIPVPVPVPSSSDDDDDEHRNGNGRADIIRMLRSDPYRLTAAKDAVDKALKSGCDTTHIREVADFWRVSMKWSRPQLHFRISNAFPGDNPTEHWPPPDPRTANGRTGK